MQLFVNLHETEGRELIQEQSDLGVSASKKVFILVFNDKNKEGGF